MSFQAFADGVISNGKLSRTGLKVLFKSSALVWITVCKRPKVILRELILLLGGQTVFCLEPFVASEEAPHVRPGVRPGCSRMGPNR